MSEAHGLPDPQTYPYHRYVVAVRKSQPKHAPPDWPGETVRTVYEKQIEETEDGKRYFVWKPLTET